MAYVRLVSGHEHHMFSTEIVLIEIGLQPGPVVPIT